MLSDTMGSFSFGNSLTIADICLASIFYNATVKYSLDMTPFPNINKVIQSVNDTPCIKQSHPDLQPAPTE
ncbi:hypothetical protein HDU98_006878 [Podochytrium sp. JEL0797]|nr:hypothetical protein HDU98_006878 [Podochytrium sp. JEL0797]